MPGHKPLPLLDEIGRIARLLKKQSPIQHALALDIAAKQLGYQNIRHAQNAAKTNPSLTRQSVLTLPAGFPITVGKYWVDRDLGVRGREILEVVLSRPLDEISSMSRLNLARGLQQLIRFGASRFEMEYVSSSQIQARENLYLAARTLAFMDATGLQPSSGYRRALPAGQWSVPGEDHSSAWYDPATRRYLIADEPYQRDIRMDMPKRMEWLERFGYVMQCPVWPGMYNPYMDVDNGSRLHLITHATKGVDLDRVVSALNRLPPPIGNRPWGGVSAELVPLAGSRLASAPSSGLRA